MRYRLRTLLIVMALGPVVLAAIWFTTPDSLFLLAFYGAAAAGVLAYHFYWARLPKE